MKTVGVPLSEEVVSQLDAMVADGTRRGQGFFRSRAHVVRAAIRQFVAKHTPPAGPTTSKTQTAPANPVE